MSALDRLATVLLHYSKGRVSNGVQVSRFASFAIKTNSQFDFSGH
jgi:hypothetical protein